ncbi:MAG: DUF2851 family protein [Tannerellaceae bacterium]|jgi:hypothetical protein|nr:DUF2851 family protein [Tannerellaceae bacterium]
MERLLHYVWKHRLFPPGSLVTTDGLPVSVIDTGIQNTNAGPDFFNAQVKIGEIMWAGCVEIHDKSSDWIRHHHDKDKAYDAVVLHLTGKCDIPVYRTTGDLIPQAILTVPETVQRNIDWLIHREEALPCLSGIKNIDPIHLSAWTNALLCERLERKTNDILRLLEQYNDDWNEVFYIILTRTFGFGVNNDAFERLAKSIPFRYIQKHRGSSLQIEALLFGQAGMLQEEDDGLDTYFQALQKEYRFLRHKFELTPLDDYLFKSLRMRPGSFPHIRLAQLAALWMRYDSLFSVIRDEENLELIKKLFKVHPSAFWQTHNHFRNNSPKAEKYIGEGSLSVLLINVAVPMLFAFGQKNKLPEHCERAICFLESIPAESNSIVSTFCRAGIKAHHAGDSQALIQLKREYCEKKQCLHCRIGFRLLKRERQ